MKRASFKKALLMLSASILTIGVITPIVSSCSSNTSKNTNNCKYLNRNQISNFKTSLNTYLNSSLDTPTSNDNKQKDSDKITSGQLSNFIELSKAKLTYKLQVAGVAEDKVINTVGTYLHNVKQIQNDETSKDEVSVLSDDQELTTYYDKVLEENKKVGIDVVDYDDFINNTAVELVNSYSSTFKDIGHTDDETKAMATNLLNAFSKSAKQGIDEYDNQFELMQDLITNGSMDFLCDDSSKIKETRENALLQNALSFEQNLFTSERFSTQNSVEFLKYYSDYLGEDKKTPDETIHALKVGDIVPEQLLKYLITYQYDETVGALLDPDDFSIQPEDIEESSTSDYDSSALAFSYTNAPLDTHKTHDATYGLGEFVPGYALKLAIKSVENNEDSHVCNIVFTKGVSHKDSSGKESIIWDTNDNTLATANKDEKGDVKVTIDIDEKHADLVQNLSNNVYYKDNYVADLSAVGTAALNNNSAYFEDSVKTRAKLDDLMAGYEGDVYDFSKNPYYITGENAKKALPDSLALPKGIDFDTTLHTNQQLALIPNDINSSVYTLSMRIGIVDTFTFKDENGAQKNTQNVVKYLKWRINGTDVDSINVQFAIGNKLAKEIEFAKNFYSALESLTLTKEFLFKSNVDIKQLDSLEASTKRSLIWHTFYYSQAIIFIVLNEIYTAALAVTAFLTASFFTFAIQLAFLALNTWCGVEITKEEACKIIPDKKQSLAQVKCTSQLLKTAGDTTTNVFAQINDEMKTNFSHIAEDYNPLFDSHGTFANKQKAAEIIIKHINNKDFLDTFVKIIKDNPSIFMGVNVDSLSPIDFDNLPDDSQNDVKQSSYVFDQNNKRRTLSDGSEDNKEKNQDNFGKLCYAALMLGNDAVNFIFKIPAIVELKGNVLNKFYDMFEKTEKYKEWANTFKEYYENLVGSYLVNLNPGRQQSFIDVRTYSYIDKDFKEANPQIFAHFDGLLLDNKFSENLCYITENLFRYMYGDKDLYPNLAPAIDNWGESFLQVYKDTVKEIYPKWYEGFNNHINELINSYGNVADFMQYYISFACVADGKGVNFFGKEFSWFLVNDANIKNSPFFRIIYQKIGKIVCDNLTHLLSTTNHQELVNLIKTKAYGNWSYWQNEDNIEKFLSLFDANNVDNTKAVLYKMIDAKSSDLLWNQTFDYSLTQSNLMTFFFKFPYFGEKNAWSKFLKWYKEETNKLQKVFEGTLYKFKQITAIEILMDPKLVIITTVIPILMDIANTLLTYFNVF